MEREDDRSEMEEGVDRAGVGSDAEIDGNGVCESAREDEIPLLVDAECDRPEGELRSVKLEDGRIGGVGGKKMRLYSLELWRWRLLGGMQSTPSRRLDIDGREHLR